MSYSYSSSAGVPIERAGLPGTRVSMARCSTVVMKAAELQDKAMYLSKKRFRKAVVSMAGYAQ